jgi:hypothetical protein
VREREVEEVFQLQNKEVISMEVLMICCREKTKEREREKTEREMKLKHLNLIQFLNDVAETKTLDY